MNKLASMIANGEISVEELANAEELIERAKFVKEALEACKKTLVFPFGVSKIKCYSYMDSAGEYQSWGDVTNNGLFTCYCNWGGNHQTGCCNLTDFAEVFIAFENSDFMYDLRRFLTQQIEKANATK